MSTQQALLVITLSYIIGSFPTAYLVGKLVKNINIFEYGSGNMGATNVSRTLGTKWGIFVSIVDLSKGILAVWLARQIAPAHPLSTQASASVISAISVVIGHNWSFFASLITGSIRGGKGAATAAGTWIILMPAIVIVLPLIVIALVVVTTRYMSLGVLTSVVVGSLVLCIMVLQGSIDSVYLLYLTVSVMIFYRHRENIKRLIAGNERRFGDRIETN